MIANTKKNMPDKKVLKNTMKPEKLKEAKEISFVKKIDKSTKKADNQIINDYYIQLLFLS